MTTVQKKVFANNVPGLKQKLSELKLDLPWIERLDMINKKAPLAPELAYKEDQSSIKDEKSVHDDFVREMGFYRSELQPSSPKQVLLKSVFARALLFYRQAQSAVLEAIPRLKSMSVPTKRPDDYFAQMAKSDQHMQKVWLMITISPCAFVGNV